MQPLSGPLSGLRNFDSPAQGSSFPRDPGLIDFIPLAYLLDKGIYPDHCSGDAHFTLPRDRLGANIQNKTKELTHDETEFLENKRSRRVCVGGGKTRPLCRGRKTFACRTDRLWLVRKDRSVSSDP